MSTTDDRVPPGLIAYVKERMAVHHYNSSSLAAAASLSRQAIYNLVEGKKMPKPSTIQTLAPLLGSSEDHMMKLAGYTSGPPKLTDRMRALMERIDAVLPMTSATEAEITIDMIDGIITRLEQTVRRKKSKR